MNCKTTSKILSILISTISLLLFLVKGQLSYKVLMIKYVTDKFISAHYELIKNPAFHHFVKLHKFMYRAKLWSLY